MEEPVKKCRKCDSAWGLFGIIAGLGILFIGADLLSGGAITRAISGGGRRLAAVVPIRSADDSAG